MVADERVKVPASCEKRLGRGGWELNEDRIDGRFVEQRYPGKPVKGGGAPAARSQTSDQKPR